MSIRTEAKAFQIMAPQSSSELEYHLELRGSLFFSVSRAGDVTNSAVGFYIPVAAIPSPRTVELVREAAHLLPGTGEQSLKLVGESSKIDEATAMLIPAGFSRIEKKPKSGALEILFTPNTGRVRVAQVLEVETKQEGSGGKTRVMIIDDSKTIRNLLEKILSSDPEIEVVGSAEKPSDAEKMLEKLGTAKRPHVITLDIHMPEMDGVAFLKKYLPKFPIPTIMISSISLEEGPMVLSALESGAVDYVQKPSFEQLKHVAPLILEKVKQARHAKIQLTPKRTRVDRPAKKATLRFERSISSSPVIAIGSSTGGTEALRQFFLSLPEEIPPIVVVQHIPPVFSKAFADRMNELCPFTVKEAVDGDPLLSNQVLIAPGATQMRVVKEGNGYKVQVDPDAAHVNRHKPSVDVLFDTIGPLFGDRAVGVILTGMGADGAKGLLRMKQSGSRTFGQDEASSVVYGMPRAAFEIGAVDRQLPLGDIPAAVIEWLATKRKIA